MQLANLVFEPLTAWSTALDDPFQLTFTKQTQFCTAQRLNYTRRARSTDRVTAEEDGEGFQ